MTRATDSSDTPVQPPLADLMARYLARQADNHAAGLAAVETTGEVVPFEAAPVQTIDPRLAWEESLATVRFFASDSDVKTWQAPPEWPLLVAAHEPAVALAFALGNYPQLVRHMRPLLQGADLAQLRPSAGRPVAAPGLLTWATQTAKKKQYPQILLAIGALRLARQFEAAEGIIQAHRSEVPESWQPLWANEEAALAWHRGNADEAAALWQKQAESAPVLFNRGMAALFLGRSAEARTWLDKASHLLPEAGAWHHLAGLYLALAEMRG